MAFEAKVAAAGIEAELRAQGTPERAAGEKRYLKSELEHLGAGVGQIRARVRALTSRHRDLSHTELVALVEALWSRPVHECRLAAALTLDAKASLLGARDLPLLEQLVRQSKTWALVDVLAVNVTGAIVLSEPSAAAGLDRWARDDDFWLRRAALLAMLKPLREGAPLDRFGRWADSMLDERELFIRKAIGWVLRETGKRRGDEVFAWLAPRTDRASGVTMREAVKYLRPAQRDELLAAYRERRPAAGPRPGL